MVKIIGCITALCFFIGCSQIKTPNPGYSVTITHKKVENETNRADWQKNNNSWGK